MSENNFKELGYKVITGLIDPTKFHDHLKTLSADIGYKHDNQVDGAKSFYKDEVFEQLLTDLLPVIEQHSGYELYKTYSYARYYYLGNILKSHYDRPACEITVSICLGNEGQPWPIWLLDKDECPMSITLGPGDAVMFSGVTQAHWRSKNVFGPCGQVFLHYVDRNGIYSCYKDDTPKNQSAPTPGVQKHLSFKFLKKTIEVRINIANS